MAAMSSQALRAAVREAAATDPSFRDALLRDADKAVKARFGDQSVRVRVQVDVANELAIVIPQKTEQLARAVERLVSELGSAKPEPGQFQALVVHQAWNEPGFLARLRSDPRGALNSVLQKYNSWLPEGALVGHYEEGPGELLIFIPPGAEGQELSDTDLEGVAGGFWGVGSLAVAAGAAQEKAKNDRAKANWDYIQELAKWQASSGPPYSPPKPPA